MTVNWLLVDQIMLDNAFVGSCFRIAEPVSFCLGVRVKLPESQQDPIRISTSSWQNPSRISAGSRINFTASWQDPSRILAELFRILAESQLHVDSAVRKDETIMALFSIFGILIAI